MKLSDFIVVLPRMVRKCTKFRRDLLNYCSLVLFRHLVAVAVVVFLNVHDFR